MKFVKMVIIAEAILFMVDDACQRLGISKSLLYELVKAGNNLIYKLGSKTLIPSYSIENVVQMAYGNGVTWRGGI
jgi:excisionase family DNA binding protein